MEARNTPPTRFVAPPYVLFPVNSINPDPVFCNIDAVPAPLNIPVMRLPEFAMSMVSLRKTIVAPAKSTEFTNSN
jgi:hypothetical protein